MNDKTVSDTAKAIHEDIAAGKQPNPNDMTKVFGDIRKGVEVRTSECHMDILVRLDACAECEQAPLAPLLSDAATEIRKLRSALAAVDTLADNLDAWIPTADPIGPLRGDAGMAFAYKDAALAIRTLLTPAKASQ